MGWCSPTRLKGQGNRSIPMTDSATHSGQFQKSPGRFAAGSRTNRLKEPCPRNPRSIPTVRDAMPPYGISSTAACGFGAKRVSRGGGHATESRLLHGGGTRPTHDLAVTKHGYRDRRIEENRSLDDRSYRPSIDLQGTHELIPALRRAMRSTDGLRAQSSTVRSRPVTSLISTRPSGWHPGNERRADPCRQHGRPVCDGEFRHGTIKPNETLRWSLRTSSRTSFSCRNRRNRFFRVH